MEERRWENHVRSSCVFLLHRLRQIRLLAAQGESITEGGDYVALPEWGELEPSLSEAEDSLRRLLDRLSLKAAADGATPEKTRFFLRQILNELLDELDDLRPERIQRGYGRVDASDGECITDAVDRARSSLQKMRTALD